MHHSGKAHSGLPVCLQEIFPVADTNTPENPAWNMTISITVKPDTFTPFFPLLQTGVTLEVDVGCTIKELLEDQIGLAPDYVEQRIQTIFLDAKPVDDPGTAVVRNGASLTLSAAMPGLLGAMLRKQSICAVLRCQITHTEAEEAGYSGKGLVVLRLFNFLGREVGPELLRQGVGVSGDDLQDLLGKSSDPFWEEMELNGEDVDAAGLGKEVLSGKHVFLQVRSK
jgi:hypothetical protein